jgi:anthranilate phosphoribosyltransferase
MTDRQYQSILSLVAALIEKCKTEEEIKEAAKLIRELTKTIPQGEEKPKKQEEE